MGEIDLINKYIMDNEADQGRKSCDVALTSEILVKPEVFSICSQTFVFPSLTFISRVRGLGECLI